MDALGYVVKPVSYLAFSQILGKAIKKVLRATEKLPDIEVRAVRMRLDIGQIYYIEKPAGIMFSSTQKKEIFLQPDL